MSDATTVLRDRSSTGACHIAGSLAHRSCLSGLPTSRAWDVRPTVWPPGGATWVRQVPLSRWTARTVGCAQSSLCWWRSCLALRTSGLAPHCAGHGCDLVRGLCAAGVVGAAAVRLLPTSAAVVAHLSVMSSIAVLNCSPAALCNTTASRAAGSLIVVLALTTRTLRSRLPRVPQLLDLFLNAGR
jgi:hypothetical protein